LVGGSGLPPGVLARAVRPRRLIMRRRLFGILTMGVAFMWLNAQPGASAADKERAIHFWGTIIEIDKSGHNFTVEGRWAFIPGENEKDEGRSEPTPKTDDRQRAHFIELVTSGPAIHPTKLKCCCVEGKTTVWKLNGDPGQCRDLKKDAHVRVWVNGKCEPE